MEVPRTSIRGVKVPRFESTMRRGSKGPSIRSRPSSPLLLSSPLPSFVRHPPLAPSPLPSFCWFFAAQAQWQPCGTTAGPHVDPLDGGGRPARLRRPPRPTGEAPPWARQPRYLGAGLVRLAPRCGAPARRAATDPSTARGWALAPLGACMVGAPNAAHAVWLLVLSTPTLRAVGLVRTPVVPPAPAGRCRPQRGAALMEARARRSVPLGSNVLDTPCGPNRELHRRLQ